MSALMEEMTVEETIESSFEDDLVHFYCEECYPDDYPDTVFAYCGADVTHTTEVLELYPDTDICSMCADVRFCPCNH